MSIPPDVLLARTRAKLLNTARQYSTGTYSRQFVAPLFQRMIRAEAGADPRPYVTAVVAGVVRQVARDIGECVCVTCGQQHKWNSGIQGLHTGHFLASRCNSILYEEANVAPQCAHCNYYSGGAPQQFRQWMEAVRGPKEIERLQMLKTQPRSFTREELVEMRIAFQSRLKIAVSILTDV